jgi:hypothetical protein
MPIPMCESYLIANLVMAVVLHYITEEACLGYRLKPSVVVTAKRSHAFVLSEFCSGDLLPWSLIVDWAQD